MIIALKTGFSWSATFILLFLYQVITAQNIEEEIRRKEQEYHDFIQKKQEEAFQYSDFEKYKYEQAISQAKKELAQFMQQKRIEFLEYEKEREKLILKYYGVDLNKNQI